jgi:hypothetical protein
MVTSVVGGPDEFELPALATTAELPALTAATATLRPPASTAELASATIMRVRTSFIRWPLPERPRISRVITLCHADADKHSLTCTKGDGQRGALPSLQVGPAATLIPPA